MNLSNPSDVLSLIAIIVAIGSAIYQLRHETQVNTINLEADYFKELYMTHLLRLLPKTRTYLRFDKGTLMDIDRMIDELNAIRNDSLYFMYVDSSFYEKLKMYLQDLEDFLIITSNQSIVGPNQEEVFKDIEIKLEDIYELLSKKYHGK